MAETISREKLKFPERAVPLLQVLQAFQVIDQKEQCKNTATHWQNILYSIISAFCMFCYAGIG